MRHWLILISFMLVSCSQERTDTKPDAPALPVEIPAALRSGPAPFKIELKQFNVDGDNVVVLCFVNTTGAPVKICKPIEGADLWISSITQTIQGTRERSWFEKVDARKFAIVQIPAGGEFKHYILFAPSYSGQRMNVTYTSYPIADDPQVWAGTVKTGFSPGG